jgi:hypothetical protein
MERGIYFVFKILKSIQNINNCSMKKIGKFTALETINNVDEIY